MIARDSVSGPREVVVTTGYRAVSN